MKAIVTVGISASGKTTWANDFCKQANRGGSDGGGLWSIICRDDIRRKILAEKHKRDIEPGELWKLWKFKDEDKVSVVYREELEAAAKDGMNVICCDTNLSSKHRDSLTSMLTGLGFAVEIKEFPVSVEDAWRRDAARADGVGHSVIAKQMRQWDEYISRKTVHNTNPSYLYEARRKAVVVDIDGTLAHNTSGRGWFENDKVHLDSVDEVVRMVVEGFKAKQYSIIVLSGREGTSICRGLTAKWLTENKVPYDYLFMRLEGDFRDDATVKEEIYWEEIHDMFDVVCVIDDRPKVCRAWRAIGLKTLQVGDPHVEF